MNIIKDGHIEDRIVTHFTTLASIRGYDPQSCEVGRGASVPEPHSNYNRSRCLAKFNPEKPRFFGDSCWDREEKFTLGLTTGLPLLCPCFY